MTGTGCAATMTAREARDRFLETFGLDMEGYTSPTLPLPISRGITLNVPNPGLLRYHDLHHVATGYPATLLGEAQISAFELRAGCHCPLIFCLCLGAITIGGWRSPGTILRAWRNARGARTLYDTDIPYETLLQMSVADLRRRIGIKETAPYE